MVRLILLPILLLSQLSFAQIPHSPLSDQVKQTIWPKLLDQLDTKGFQSNKPIFLRILKEERTLEVWMLKGKRYALFKEYPICTYSGGLGTKTREGDGKSPEGFYTITSRQLNPYSNYRLSINIGYPNAMEQANKYTGSAIMIHGGCASIGCYAMTDAGIDEIYTLVSRALSAGQKAISLHILPFKITNANLQAHAGYSCISYWDSLKPISDDFERNKIPPTVSTRNNRYAFK